MLTAHELIASRAGKSPEHPAIAAPSCSSLSYGALLDLIEQTQDALNRAGLGRQAPIGIVVPNGPEMATVFLAMAASATVAQLNPQCRHEEFAFYLSDSNAKALITMSDSTSPALDVAEEIGILCCASCR